MDRRLAGADDRRDGHVRERVGHRAPASMAGGLPRPRGILRAGQGSGAMTPALVIEDLWVEAGPTDDPLVLVRGVDLTVGAGTIVGLVGESGSGKTVTCMSALGLAGRGVRITRGSVRAEGTELVGADEATMRRVRGGVVGTVFQDPLSSLNPLAAHRRPDRRGARAAPWRAAAHSSRPGDLLARPRSGSPHPRSACGPIRTSSRAACASVSRSPWRSPTTPPCSSPTSRRPPSTSPSRRRCSTWSATRRATRAVPRCS